MADRPLAPLLDHLCQFTRVQGHVDVGREDCGSVAMARQAENERKSATADRFSLLCIT